MASTSAPASSGRARSCQSSLTITTGARSQAPRHSTSTTVKSRAPSFYACQALDKMIVGGLIADVIAVIGSTDVVMGDVDR